MILAVHAHPALIVPLALAIAAPLAWYWVRLGRDDVPASRRRIRRGSMILMGAILVMLVIGLSIVDETRDKNAYLLTWAGAMIAVMLMIPVALLDAANNMSLYRRNRSRMLAESTDDILRTARVNGPESGGS
jgi:hypothetical protein